MIDIESRLTVLSVVGRASPDVARHLESVRAEVDRSGVEWLVVVGRTITSDADDALQAIVVPALGRVLRGEEPIRFATAIRLAATRSQAPFLLYVDARAELVQGAVHVVLDELERVPTIDVLYGDDEVLSAQSSEGDRFWKPAFSSERLLAQNYLGSHFVARRTRLLGDGSAPGHTSKHDVVLDLTAQGANVAHIDEVLVRVAGDAAAQYAADEAAVVRHLAARGVHADVTSSIHGLCQVRRHPVRPHRVSIVIPTAGTSRSMRGVERCLIENCVATILDRTEPSDYEIIIVHAASMAPQIAERLLELASGRLTLLPFDRPFNFADQINRGVVASDGDVLVLLNDDTEVLTETWLRDFCAILEDPDLGMVGPCLLFEDDRIQSAGHFNHPGPRNLATGVPSSDPGPFDLLAVPSERTGVTAACAAIRRDVFDAVGGLSYDFPVNFNDVDLSLKLISIGYRIVWTPLVRLRHLESASRPASVTESEVRRLFRGGATSSRTTRSSPSARRWR